MFRAHYFLLAFGFLRLGVAGLRFVDVLRAGARGVLLAWISGGRLRAMCAFRRAETGVRLMRCFARALLLLRRVIERVRASLPTIRVRWLMLLGRPLVRGAGRVRRGFGRLDRELAKARWAICGFVTNRAGIVEPNGSVRILCGV